MDPAEVWKWRNETRTLLPEVSTYSFKILNSGEESTYKKAKSDVTLRCCLDILRDDVYT